MSGLGTKRRMEDGPLGFLTDDVVESPDAEALEDRSTRSVDMHDKGDDLEACVMDAKDIRDDETVGVLTHEESNNENRGAVVLLMGAVIDDKAEADKDST